MPTILCDADSTRGKRKRGTGEYIDPETGDKRIIETSRHVKAQHKKNGTWYKKPTETELRRWDREEELQKRADKIKQRDANKQINSAKRAVKEAKERDRLMRQFEEGKITFTQTLGKKDASQLNLHGWFGGGASKELQKPGRDQLAEHDHNDRSSEDNENETETSTPAVDEDVISNAEAEELNEKSSVSPSQNLETRRLPPTHFTPDLEALDRDRGAEINLDTKPPQQPDSRPAEVSDPNHELMPKHSQNPTQSEKAAPALERTTFKVPSLPSRMQKTHANDHEWDPSPAPKFDHSRSPTLSVLHSDEDLFSGLCTQDLIDADLVVNESRNSFTSMLQNNVVTHQQVALDPHQTASQEEFEDRDLDDETLLSLPATQLAAKNQFSKNSKHLRSHVMSTTRPDAVDQEDEFEDFSSLSDTDLLECIKPVKDGNRIRSPLRRASSKRLIRTQCDSFAMSEFSDDDLLEGLQQYEQTQELARQNNRSSLPGLAISRKKRILPWNLVTPIASQSSFACKEEQDNQEQEPDWSVTPSFSQCSV